MAYDPYADNAGKARGNTGYLTFDWDKTGKKPKFLKHKDNGQEIGLDIIPFKIASKNFPAVAQGKAEIGEEAYAMDFWVHRGVGPGKKYNVICPQETYGQRCPICEQRDAIGRQYGWKSSEFKDAPKGPAHRIIYNVIKSDDDKEELMVLEENFNHFEQPLLTFSAAKAKRQGKNFLRFGDLAEGYSIYATVMMKLFSSDDGAGTYATYSFTDIEKRAKPHNPALVNETIPFDKYVIRMSEEEIQRIISGEAAEEEEAAPVASVSHPVEGNVPEGTWTATAAATPPVVAPPPAAEPDPICPVGGEFGKECGDFGKVCSRCAHWTKCKAKKDKM
jgi:hypothetical protein